MTLTGAIRAAMRILRIASCILLGYLVRNEQQRTRGEDTSQINEIRVEEPCAPIDVKFYHARQAEWRCGVIVAGIFTIAL